MTRYDKEYNNEDFPIGDDRRMKGYIFGVTFSIILVSASSSFSFDVGVFLGMIGVIVFTVFGFVRGLKSVFRGS